jgi:hypothetical protein
MGGVIGKVLSFERVTRNEANLSDVKIDVGGGEILTAEYAHGPGDDDHPLPDDYVLAVQVPGSGRLVVAAFVEPDAQQTAQAGERRMYARDANRAEIVQFYLKNDGTAVMSNANGTFELRPDGSYKGNNASGFFELEVGGDFVANGAKMKTNGDVVTSDGVSLRDHPHEQGNDSNGDTEVATDAPTATE